MNDKVDSGVADEAAQPTRWRTRMAIAKNMAASALKLPTSRQGGALVTGISRARAVDGDQHLPQRVDTVVIGGGNIGSLTALTLAERGLSVALCEKGVIAGESSGRSLGYIDSLFLDPIKLAVVARSKTLWEALDQRIQGITGYQRTGLLTGFTSAEGMEAAAGWLAAVKGLPGIDARLTSADETTRLSPGCSEPFVGGLYQASDGCAEPQWAAPAIAEAARRAGVKLFQHCAVRGVDRAAGKVCGVVTEKGYISCENVVLAGGVWSPLMARSLGLELPQFMAFASVARLGEALPVDDPMPPHDTRLAMINESGFALRQSGLQSWDICAPMGMVPLTPQILRNLPQLGPALLAMKDQLQPVLNASTFLSQWRQPKRWALDKPSPFESCRILMPEVFVPPLDEAIGKMRSVFSAAQAMLVQERWAGILTSTPDNMPVISAAESIPGLYIGSGFYYGLTMAPAAAEALADLVTGQTPQIDLTPYRLSRFTDTSPLVFRA